MVLAIPISSVYSVSSNPEKGMELLVSQCIMAAIVRPFFLLLMTDYLLLLKLLLALDILVYEPTPLPLSSLGSQIHNFLLEISGSLTNGVSIINLSFLVI